MKKILCVTSIALLSSLSANGYFVGFEGSKGSGDSTLSSDLGYSSTSDYDSSSLIFKFGKIKKNTRWTISYESIDMKFDSVTDKVIGLNSDLDYLFNVNTRFFPLIGAGIGFLKYENTAYLFVDDEDLRGIALNLRLGVLAKVDQNIALEVGYKYKNIQWQNIEGYDYDETLELESKQNSLYFGVNILF